MPTSVTFTVGATGDFNTIADALAGANIASADEVIIIIADGTYDEDLSITRAGVTLQGSSNAIIDGYIVVTGDDTTLSGVTIANGGSVWGTNAAVVVGADNLTVTGVTFDGAGNTHNAIETAANGATGLSVTGSSFEGWNKGIWVNPGMTDLLVTGNSFAANNNGMAIDGPNVTGDVSGNNFISSVGSHIGMGTWSAGTIDASALIGTNTFGGTNSQVSLFGTGGNDTLIGTDGPNRFFAEGGNDVIHASAGDTIDGGTGTDTVIYAEGTDPADVVAASGNISGAELIRVDGVAGDTFVVLNGMSIQAAIDAAADGDTILVAPGSYTGSANYNAANNTNSGSNPVGLLINKSVTIQGVDANGAAITDKADIAATFTSGVQSNWGTNIHVTAADVTIRGLTLLGVDSIERPVNQPVNKVLEVLKGGFVLEASIIGAAPGEQVTANGFGAIYINDENASGLVVSDIDSFTISGNTLGGSMTIANGAGFGVVDPDFTVTDNLFTGSTGIGIQGQITGFGWLLAPALAPTTITGNTFDPATTRLIREIESDLGQIDIDLAYIEAFIANNTVGDFAYIRTAANELKMIPLAGGTYFAAVADDRVQDLPPLAAGETLVTQDGAFAAAASGNTFYVFEGQSIQAALDAAVTGDTIIVGDGTFNENLLIDTAGITLKSLNGRASTTINGSDASGLLGTIQIVPGTDNVTIDGLTIVGINGNGAIEKAAVYIQGANNGLIVTNNEIVAKGDAGLMSEYGLNVSNAQIDGNIFSGKTFVGANPESSGANTFSIQFDVGNDAPRQLVVMGNGGSGPSVGSNIIFTNNIVSGTTGGISSVTGLPFGNNLVTIDVPDSTISDNTFTGFTGIFTAALRARRDGIDIEDNLFDLSGGGQFAFPNSVFVQNNTTGTVADNRFIDANGNEWFPGGAGSETIVGTEGDDMFIASAGNDDLDGAGGTDTLDMSTAGSGGAFVDLNTGLAFSSATGLDNLANIENVIGSSGNDGLYGDDYDNVFIATGGSDVIDGRGGSDTFDASAATAAMTVDLETGEVSGAHTAALTSVENIKTGSGGDTVTTSDADNRVETGAGNDIIFASAGNDVIDGGDGNDEVDYGATMITIGMAEGGGAWSVEAPTAPSAPGLEPGDEQTLTNVEIVHSGAGRTLLVGNGGYATIHDALAVAQADDTILVAEGTYAGGFNITVEGLTIKAVGEVVIEGNFRTLNNIGEGDSVAEWLQGVSSYAGGENAAITVAANGVTLEGLDITEYNIGVSLMTSISDLTLTNLDISSGITGIRKSTAATIDNLAITGGSFSDMQHGMTLYKANSVAGRLSNFTVDGASFSNLNEKGIYLESGDNVLLTNLTMDNVGEFGRTQSFGGVGQWGNGIDINLKFSSGAPYSDITISDSTFTNVGTSDGGGSPHLGGAAIGVKTRDDGAPYGPNPATFDGDLKIENVTIDGTSVGIRVGEPGPTNAGPSVDVTGTTITNAVTAEVDNRSVSTLKVTLGDGGEVWAAAATTTGAIAFTGGEGDDNMTGGGGADSFAGGGGNDTVDGGAGLDTVTFAGDRDNYTIMWDGTNATVSNGTDTVTITNAGRLDFGDKDVILVAEGTEFATVQAGVDATVNGDEVLIASGTYTGNVTIAGKSISLIGDDSGVAVHQPSAGVVIEGQISTTGLMATNDVLRFQNLTIDAAGQQYGLFLRNSATDVSGVNGGSIIVNNVTIENASANGMFYAHPSNGSNPLNRDTVGTIQILDSDFYTNGEVYSGARGHGHVNLFGFNGNLTVDQVSMTSTETGLDDSGFRYPSGSGLGVTTNGAAAYADKAFSVTGVRVGTPGVDGYADAGALVLNNISVTGRYSSDVMSFYTIGAFASMAIAGVDINASARWSLVNFDSVSGPIDLSSGLTLNNSSLIAGSRTTELQGLATDDAMTGTDGVDILIGRGGVDSLYGGAGNDVFLYTDAAHFATAESLDGGDDDDSILFTGAGTLVLGENITNVEQAVIGHGLGAGLDASAMAEAITLSGGAGNDTLTGGAGADLLYGGEGNDTFRYEDGSLAAADSIHGGDGADVVAFTGTTGTLTMGANVTGIETISVQSAADVDVDASAVTYGLEINGGDGANTLTGTGSADSIDGGMGNDTLIGGDGNDTLDGGDGTDTADYSGSGAAVFANLLLGTAFGSEIGNDTLISIEAITGGAGNDALVAGNGGNRLDGGAGNDSLTGGTGDDTLVAGAGVDVLVGGDGSDTAEFALDWADYAISQTGGTFTIGEGSSSASVTGVETFIFNGVSYTASEILNLAPDDILFENDTPSVDENDAGAEITRLDATDPNTGDTVTLSVNDTRFEIVAAAPPLMGMMLPSLPWILKLKDGVSLDHETADTVTLTITATDAAGATRQEQLVVTVTDVNEAPEPGPGLGTWTPDAVETGAIGASLFPEAGITDPDGDDLTYTLLTGPSAGRLLLNGVEVLANDTLSGADLEALVFETLGVAVGPYDATFEVTDGEFTQGLTLNLNVVDGVDSVITGTAGADTLDGAAGFDTITGLGGDDLLYGGIGRDKLNGGSGKDTLYGGNGNDVLRGGNSADMLFGGNGNDTLNGGDGYDTLEGGIGADVFVLSVAEADYGLNPRVLITDFETGVDKMDLTAYGLTFVGASAFSNSGQGQVRFTGSNDRLVIDFDGDGLGDLRIQFGTDINLTVDDLLL